MNSGRANQSADADEHGDCRARGEERHARRRSTSKAQQREDRDQDRADRDRGRAPGIADVEARRAHDRLVDRVLDRRIDDEQDERGDHQQDRRSRSSGAAPAPARPMKVVSRMCALRRIASTAPSTESQTNSVEASSSRPDQRPMEEIARDHADEQQPDLEQQDGGRDQRDRTTRAACSIAPIQALRGAGAVVAAVMRACDTKRVSRQDKRAAVLLQDLPGLLAELAAPLGIEAGGLQRLLEGLLVDGVEGQPLLLQLRSPAWR